MFAKLKFAFDGAMIGAAIVMAFIGFYYFLRDLTYWLLKKTPKTYR